MGNALQNIFCCLLKICSWYCIRAKVDSFLGDAIREKKLVKGCKISICSASFYHLDEEHPENTVLSLHFNGVRRARWDSKLGLRR